MYLPQTLITKYIKLPVILENSKIFKTYAKTKQKTTLITCHFSFEEKI